MSDVAKLRGVIDGFLDRGTPFWPFYHSFMDVWKETSQDSCGVEPFTPEEKERKS